MKKTNKILTFTVIGILTIFLLGPIAFTYWFASGFVNKPNPEYQEYVSKRINFATTRMSNTLQRDTIYNRINNFFSIHTEFNVPDSIKVKERICNGCAEIQKVIFFQNPPIEIYRVNFGMGFNYIDKIYKLEEKNFNLYLSENLDSKEKNRIKTRLEKSVLKNINWNIDNINH